DYSLKVKDRQPKWLLKQLLRRYLPSHLVDRPKWGFSVPLQKWLLTDLRYLIDEHLSDQSVQEVGLFQGEFVRALKDSFYKGQDYLYNRIWLLIAIQKWMKENG
ncbi:MAG: asparagine synthase-related protein, partial [Bacteroidota bacterium]